jgi:hypothetical protein
MAQDLVRYVLVASASATVGGVVSEAWRRVAGTQLDRQLRDQHPQGS